MDRVAGFDWDDGNFEKCQKHGVSPQEIEALLMSAPRIAPDLKHSSEENRFIAVGRNHARRPLYVAFTFRRKAGRLLIRPVSARYMHEKEVKAYETQSARDEDG